MASFVIEYESCEGNFRWMTVEAEDALNAEMTAMEETDRFGDGIAEILSVYAGDSMGVFDSERHDERDSERWRE